MRSTEKTVTYIDRGWDGRSNPIERRSLRDNTYEHFFDNEADAVEYVRSRLSGRVNSLRSGLATAEAALAAFNAAHPVPSRHDGEVR